MGLPGPAPLQPSPQRPPSLVAPAGHYYLIHYPVGAPPSPSNRQPNPARPALHGWEGSEEEQQRPGASYAPGPNGLARWHGRALQSCMWEQQRPGASHAPGPPASLAGRGCTHAQRMQNVQRHFAAHPVCGGAAAGQRSPRALPAPLPSPANAVVACPPGPRTPPNLTDPNLHPTLQGWSAKYDEWVEEVGLLKFDASLLPPEEQVGAGALWDLPCLWSLLSFLQQLSI